MIKDVFSGKRLSEESPVLKLQQLLWGAHNDREERPSAYDITAFPLHLQEGEYFYETDTLPTELTRHLKVDILYFPVRKMFWH